MRYSKNRILFRAVVIVAVNLLLWIWGAYFIIKVAAHVGAWPF